MPWPSEWSLQNGEVSLSVWTQGLGAGNKQAWLPGERGWGDKSPPGQDSHGERPWEAGQPHLVGIGLDSRLQTCSQLFTLPWARATLSVATVCKANDQPAHGRVWKVATRLARGDCQSLPQGGQREGGQGPQWGWGALTGPLSHFALPVTAWFPISPLRNRSLRKGKKMLPSRTAS